jgi:hypothetical protein
MTDPEIIDSSDVPKPEVASDSVQLHPDSTDQLHGAVAQGVTEGVEAAVEKGVSVSKELISGVPAEIGGEAIRATVEADNKARTEAMTARDERETFLGASTVTSKVPPPLQKPPTPEA